MSENTEQNLLLSLMAEHSRTLPINHIFGELATIWLEKNPRASNSDLASHLGIKPQQCSQWKTGSDGRRPSWAALVMLAAELNKEIVINSDRVYIKRRRRRDSEPREQG